ncbi:MFS transporter [Actinobacillus vicugnae]|uniref:MFS transporter n=1 Tax=Actinobacillus vicugnae TaxID=2573093 RepID=UPI001FCC317E|nr:MFS transporter [Actinobacillus vicugnae]
MSTVLILFSPNIETLIALRLVQGFSSAGSVVISRAVVADLYVGREMTRFFGALMTINGLAPIISPIVGSLMLEFTDWRGMFVLLAIIGVLVMLGCFRFYESLEPYKRITTPVFASFGTLFKVLKNRIFMLYVLIESFGFAGMFAYIAASPFIFQAFYGLSSFAFSLCFAANGAALVIGSNIGGRLVNGLAVKLGVFGVIISSIYVAFALFTQINVWLLELGFFVQLLTLGLMLPALSTLAMSAEKECAGSASALIGFVVFVFGAIISPLVGIGDIFVSSAIAIFVSSVFTLWCYFAVRKEITEE